MSLITASDPAAWCHAEFDDEDLSERLTETASRLRTAVGDPGFPSAEDAPARDRGQLLDAIEVLEADLSSGPERVRVHNLRNSVIDVWDMAEDVDPDAAGSLELLLGQLTTTSRVSRGAVAAALEEVRDRLRGGRVSS